MKYNVTIEDGIYPKNSKLITTEEIDRKKLQKYANYFKVNIDVKINQNGAGLIIYADNSFFAYTQGIGFLFSTFKLIKSANIDIYHFMKRKNK